MNDPRKMDFVSETGFYCLIVCILLGERESSPKDVSNVS